MWNLCMPHLILPELRIHQEMEHICSVKGRHENPPRDTPHSGHVDHLPTYCVHGPTERQKQLQRGPASPLGLL